MSLQYDYKFLENDDARALLPLYQNAFGLTVRSEYVESKFFAEYQKINASSFASISGSKIVSFYGIICQKAIYNKDVFYIAQSCDSMTHKEHSGKGLFLNLAKKSYQKLEESGIKFVYGFPNKLIYGLRIKKLKWLHNENINVFKFKIKTLPFAKLIKKLPALKPLYFFYLNKMLRNNFSSASFFQNSVVKENVGGILHDADYFKYKGGKDKYVLKVNGINLWVKFDGLMWVGDFEHTSADEFSKCLSCLKKMAVKTGCTSIVFHYHEGCVNDILLKTFQQPVETIPYGFLSLEEAPVPRQFNFTGSDFDTW